MHIYIQTDRQRHIYIYTHTYIYIRSHPSIFKLKQKFYFKRRFELKPVTEEFVKNIVNNLPRNKTTGRDIPINLLKQSTFVLSCLVHSINEVLVNYLIPLNCQI